MKRFLLFLVAAFITTTAIAHTIHWYIDGNVYHTTTCESGENVTPPTAPEKYGYTFRGWLPYIQIEYLESTGTQYIDTGFYADDSSGFLIDLLMTEGIDTIALGVKGQGDSRWVCNPKFDGILLSWNNYSSSFANSDTRHELSMNFYNSRTRTVDGEIKSSQLEKLNPSASSYAVCIFASRWDSIYPQYFFIGKIYKVQITRGTDLVRDFIPVLDYNGTPCMYDTVEHKFYYNAGTGDFIAGPIVGE